MRGAMFSFIVAACLACAENPSSPTSQISQVGGLWSYSSTLVNVSGGDCVGAIKQVDVGQVTRGTILITQSDSALTAVMTSAPPTFAE